MLFDFYYLECKNPPVLGSLVFPETKLKGKEIGYSTPHTGIWVWHPLENCGSRRIRRLVTVKR